MKNKRIYKIIIFLFFVNSFFLVIFSPVVKGQAQSENFSGNSKDSYQCFDSSGRSIEPTDVRDYKGYWLCPCADSSDPVQGNGEYICNSRVLNCDYDAGKRPGDPGCPAVRAVLKPPTLQQLEIWFVRIVYIIWATVGSLSFFFLVGLGYRYMITRGDVTKITQIRQQIIYYFIGLILVFLAVPILTTIFRLIGINENVDCYNVEMPAFQFFFANLCTDPNDTFVVSPCEVILDEIADARADGITDQDVIRQRINNRIDEIIGIPCINPGEERACTLSVGGFFPSFVCENEPGETRFTWQIK